MGKLEHAKNTCQGENLYWCSGETTCKKATEAWVNEKENYDKTEGTVLQPGKMGKGDRQWGHYTQVLLHIAMRKMK
jgi:hypothetical protein